MPSPTLQAARTVTIVPPVTVPKVAVIVGLPTPVPVTRPGLTGVSSTCAMVSDDETQLT